MEQWDGIFTALLTTFDKHGNLKEDVLKQLVRWNLEKGVRGFYVCGSTGEALMLSVEERKHIMEVVRHAAPDSTLIAHIGCIDESQAAKLARYAKELKYDCVSSVAPFYYKFSFSEIRDYYYRLADTAGLPMLVYHFPAFSGVNMGMSEMRSFLDDSRFLGIKYTSNDFFTMEQCKTNFPDKIVYNGYDEMFLAGLSMGADGGIGSTYNFMADKFVQIQNHFKNGELIKAQKIQQTVNHIIAVLCNIGVMTAEKEVLNQLGFDFGICRKPFCEPDDAQKQLIAKEIIPYL